MTFLTVNPPQRKCWKHGVMVSVSYVDEGVSNIRLFLTAGFQARHFGGLIGEMLVWTKLGFGADLNHMSVELTEDKLEGLKASRVSASGDAVVLFSNPMPSWGLYGGDGECTVIHSMHCGALIKLPDWPVDQAELKAAQPAKR